MAVTKNPTYSTKLGNGDSAYKLEIAQCRFFGVVAEPTTRVTIMSPDEVTHRQSDYTLRQQEELRWRTGEWEGKPTEPPPEFANAISLEVSGEARLTTKRNINVIEDDGSNSLYRGKVTLSLSEGDPKLSRMYAVPAFSMDDEKVDESLSFHLYVSRAQIDALVTELRGTDRGLGFRLDAWGFMFGPERSFATFHQTQDYYLERTAIIGEFSVSTYSENEIKGGLKEDVVPESLPKPEPASGPMNYQPELRKLGRGIGALIALSGLTLVFLLLRTCGGH
jgi:hypothetical protein